MNTQNYCGYISLIKLEVSFLDPPGLSLPALNAFPIKTLNLFKQWGEGECVITLLLKGKLNLQRLPEKETQTEDSSITNENDTNKVSPY